jgi:hypothetical protein
MLILVGMHKHEAADAAATTGTALFAGGQSPTPVAADAGVAGWRAAVRHA